MSPNDFGLSPPEKLGGNGSTNTAPLRTPASPATKSPGEPGRPAASPSPDGGGDAVAHAPFRRGAHRLGPAVRGGLPVAPARWAAAGAEGCPGRGARSPVEEEAAAPSAASSSSSVGERGWGKQGPPPGPPPAWGAAGAAPLAGPGAPPDSACGAARGACRGGRAAPGRGQRRHEEPLRPPAVNGRRGGAGGAGAAAGAAAAAAMAQEKMELDLELPPGSAAAPSDGGGLRRSNSAPLIHGLR